MTPPPARSAPEGATTVEADPAPRARRSDYLLEELAHYGLCPYRYKHEKLASWSRLYRTEFQLGSLIQGRWIELALERLATTGDSADGPAAVEALCSQALQDVEAEVRAEFPALQEAEWVNARRYAGKSLAYQPLLLAATDGTVAVIPAEPIDLTVVQGRRAVRVKVAPRFAYQTSARTWPCTADALSLEWLRPEKRPADQTETVQIDGVRLHATLYHAIRWWQRAVETVWQYEGGERGENMVNRYGRVIYDLRTWITSIENGTYPKHPGPHCGQCPVELECLGPRGGER